MKSSTCYVLRLDFFLVMKVFLTILMESLLFRLVILIQVFLMAIILMFSMLHLLSSSKVMTRQKNFSKKLLPTSQNERLASQCEKRLQIFLQNRSSRNINDRLSTMWKIFSERMESTIEFLTVSYLFLSTREPSKKSSTFMRIQIYKSKNLQK